MKYLDTYTVELRDNGNYARNVLIQRIIEITAQIEYIENNRSGEGNDEETVFLNDLQLKRAQCIRGVQDI